MNDFRKEKSVEGIETLCRGRRVLGRILRWEKEGYVGES